MTDGVRYEVITHEDPETGDLIIPIPMALLTAMKLKEGDDVSIDISDTGNIIIKKAN